MTHNLLTAAVFRSSLASTRRNRFDHRTMRVCTVEICSETLGFRSSCGCNRGVGGSKSKDEDSNDGEAVMGNGREYRYN